MTIKNILLQFLFLGIVFSQDGVQTVIDEDYGMYFQETDKFITGFKTSRPNILNENIVINSEEFKNNFTVVNGLVSGPFNLVMKYEDFTQTFNVDYTNSIKNGKFFMKVDYIDRENVIRIEGNFLNNLKNGVFRFWSMGSPCKVFSYKNDILDGPFILFHKSEYEYPLCSDKPKMKGIYENGEVISYDEINKRGRVTYRSGKSREKFNKNMNDLQKSLETLGEIFSQ